MFDKLFVTLLSIVWINFILASPPSYATITNEDLEDMQLQIIKRKQMVYDNETAYALDLSLAHYNQIIVDGFGRFDNFNAEKMADLCQILDSRKKAADVYLTFRQTELFNSVVPLVLNKKFLKADAQRIALAREVCDFLHNPEWYTSNANLMNASIAECIEKRAARRSIPYMREYCTAYNNRAGIQFDLSAEYEITDERLQDYLKLRTEIDDHAYHIIRSICQLLNATMSNEELMKATGTALTVRQFDELPFDRSENIHIGYAAFSLGLCSALRPPAEGMALTIIKSGLDGAKRSDVIQLSLQVLNATTIREAMSASRNMCELITEWKPLDTEGLHNE